MCRIGKTLARVQQDRMKPQTILIDKIMVDQRSGQVRTPVYLDFVVMAALQPGDLVYDVTTDEPGVGLLDFVQRRRHNVLGKQGKRGAQSDHPAPQPWASGRQRTR